MTDTTAAPNADTTVTTTSADDTRPENVPEKFWNPETKSVNTEALLQSYTELEKKQGAPKTETPPKDETPPKEISDLDAAEQEATNKAAEAALKNVGLDLNTFTDEYAKDGKLSDESYKALEDAGFPKDFVDAHIEGQLALGENYTAAAHDAAGGTENFKAMTAWALASLDEQSITEFNDAVMGNKQQIVKAVKTLREAYESATGKEPTLVQGDGTSTGDVFRSQAEVNAAIRDKRWGSDSAYTADITSKISRSTY